MQVSITLKLNVVDRNIQQLYMSENRCIPFPIKDAVEKELLDLEKN